MYSSMKVYDLSDAETLSIFAAGFESRTVCDASTYTVTRALGSGIISLYAASDVVEEDEDRVWLPLNARRAFALSYRYDDDGALTFVQFATGMHHFNQLAAIRMIEELTNNK